MLAVVLAVLSVLVSAFEVRDGVSAPVAVVGVPGLSVVEDDVPESLDILGEMEFPDRGRRILASRLFCRAEAFARGFISAEG